MTRPARLHAAFSWLRRRRERGQVAVASVLSLMLIVILLALSFDAGLLYLDHRLAQNQADAAALAAVYSLPADNSSASRSAVVADVDRWLGYNGASTSHRVCPSDSSDTTAIEDLVTNTFNPVNQIETVTVCVRRPSNAMFLNLSGVTSTWVSARAKAQVVREPLYYALMAMDSDGCDMQGQISVNGNDTHVVLGGSGGAYIHRTGCGSDLNIGGARATFHAGGTIDVGAGSGCTGPSGSITSSSSASGGSPCTQRAPLDDPFSSLAPPVSGCVDLTAATRWRNGTSAAPGFNRPGRYCETGGRAPNVGPSDVTVLDCSGTTQANCFFIFERDFSVRGSLTYRRAPDGPGVLLYFTCPGGACNGSSNVAKVDFSGGNSLAMHEYNNPSGCLPASCLPMEGNPVFDNMLLWVDRTAAEHSNNSLSIQGGATVNLAGRVYGLNTEISLTGNSNTDLALNLNILADTIKFAGNQTLTINWDLTFAPTQRVVTLIE